MKEIFKLAGILMLVTAVASSALSIVNNLTKDEIEKQKRKAVKASLAVALPISARNAIHPIKKGDKILYYKGYAPEDTTRLNGYAFLAIGKGYSSKIKTMVGVDTTGKICGIKIISQKETPGLGTKIEKIDFQEQFKNKIAEDLKVVPKQTAEREGGIGSITGATISSKAVTKSIRIAIDTTLALIRAEKDNL